MRNTKAQQQVGDFPAQSGGIASNPANGINNIPLTGGAGDGGSIQPEEMIQILRQIQNAPQSQAIQYRDRVEDLLTRSQNTSIQKRLKQLLNALSMTANPKQNTIDPSTGKADPTAADIAGKLYQEINQMTSQKPQQPTASTSRIEVRIAQAKPKKKSRGNPFRVLMGKVGKLLDHGLEKSTIVREIKKRINFDEDTISRAVDIVRDYNKSKRRNDRAKKESSTVFNAARWAASRDKQDTDIYDAKPDYNRRSTAELMARKSWLEDLRDMGKDADSQGGAASELKAIRAALKARGFDDSEI